MPTSLIYHISRGQLLNFTYQKRLRELGFKISMSGKNNRYNNAVMETFLELSKFNYYSGIHGKQNGIPQ